MKKLFFLPAVALFVSTAGAQDTPGAEYEPITIGDDNYTITCDWLVQGAFEKSDKDVHTDFFIQDGVLFFNHIGFDGEHYMYKVDTSDGTYLGRVAFDWGSVGPTACGTFFTGADDEGTPYVGSFSIHGQKTYPFTITPLDIVDGIPTANKTYELTNVSGWWLYEPKVGGSLKDGNFRVVASVRAPDSYNQPRPWGYAEWNYDGINTYPTAAGKMLVSKGVVKLVEDGKVIIYNCNDNIVDKIQYDCSVPTLCRLKDDNTYEVIDTFEGFMDNSYGSGVEVARYNGIDFMIYGSGYEHARYAVAQLTNYPESLESEDLWKLDEGIQFSNRKESRNEMYVYEYCPQCIHADKDTSDGLHFYLLTAHNGVARYTIRKEQGVQTGIDEVSEMQGYEYFSVTGLPLSDRPTTPGIYIKRTSGRAEKFIVR